MVRLKKISTCSILNYFRRLIRAVGVLKNVYFSEFRFPSKIIWNVIKICVLGFVLLLNQDKFVPVKVVPVKGYSLFMGVTYYFCQFLLNPYISGAKTFI